LLVVFRRQAASGYRTESTDNGSNGEIWL